MKHVISLPLVRLAHLEFHRLRSLMGLASSSSAPTLNRPISVPEETHATDGQDHIKTLKALTSLASLDSEYFGCTAQYNERFLIDSLGESFRDGFHILY